MHERCAQWEMFGGRQCDRPASHDGVHVAGIDTDSGTTAAWPVYVLRGFTAFVPTKETVHREWEVTP